MKNLLVSIASSIILFGCGIEKKESLTVQIQEEVAVKIDKKATTDHVIYKVTNDSISNLKWTGSALGKEHFGSVDFEGSLGVKNGQLLSGLLIFNLKTINTQDLNGGLKMKLDNHLKGGDFFSVSEFPSAQLEILKYDGINLTGDLTIKEITKEITFPATISVNNTEITGQANFTINRTDFGVVYGSGNFFDLAKDQVISDEILFDVSIKAIN
jgi:hypothetical protein